MINVTSYLVVCTKVSLHCPPTRKGSKVHVFASLIVRQIMARKSRLQTTKDTKS